MSLKLPTSKGMAVTSDPVVQMISEDYCLPFVHAQVACTYYI